MTEIYYLDWSKADEQTLQSIRFFNVLKDKSIESIKKALDNDWYQYIITMKDFSPEESYILLNNRPEVLDEKINCRSMSVGDIAVINDEIFVCSNLGWTPINNDVSMPKPTRELFYTLEEHYENISEEQLDPTDEDLDAEEEKLEAYVSNEYEEIGIMKQIKESESKFIDDDFDESEYMADIERRFIESRADKTMCYPDGNE